MKDFELAVSDLIASYRHRLPRITALSALRRQTLLLTEDEAWDLNAASKDQPEDDDEPELEGIARQMQANPSPQGEPPEAA